MKANAVLRTSIEKGAQGPNKMAINMFENISGTAKEYRMKRAVLKYLIDYYISNNDVVQILKYSKRLYVETQRALDFEESKHALKAIFYGLSSLGQLEKIEQLTVDKSVKKLLPEQMILSFKIYTLIKQGHEDRVISLYEKEKSRLLAPVESSILFNVGEAYFRMAQYKKSVELFDDFLVNYSFMTKAASARLRIALSYELMGKDTNKTIELYKNVINKSPNYISRFEAQIRYVALSYLRKRQITEKDKKIKIFLENPHPKNKLEDKNLEELLWLVRLRTYIVEKDFKKALTYLRAMPMGRMNITKQRVFENEGQEIIKGLILDYYKSSDYSMIVKIWEVYNERYLSKVSSDPSLVYMMAKSLIRLGMNKTYQEFIENRRGHSKQLNKNFPIWVRDDQLPAVGNLIEELELEQSIKMKNWKQADKRLAILKKKRPNHQKNDYYGGIISYNRKQFKKVIKQLEHFISTKSKQKVYEISEIANALGAYTDSIYEIGDDDKFIRVANAILSDTRGQEKDNKFMNSVRERIAFLEIELIIKNNKSKIKTVENKIRLFKEKFSKSSYIPRVNFILGKLLVSNEKVSEGLKILENVIKNDRTPTYIKELSRAEISYFRIKERTI